MFVEIDKKQKSSCNQAWRSKVALVEDEARHAGNISEGGITYNPTDDASTSVGGKKVW